jgi:hypothetical protein
MSREDIRIVWQSGDAEVERDTLEFWRKSGLLPKGVDAGERLKQLCVVAYQNGELVGVVTVALTQINFLRARLAMIRVASPPDGSNARLRLIPARMVLAAQKVLEQWSLAHPEERVMGVGAVTAPGIYRRMNKAIWEPFGFVLVNYTPRGEQFRLAWFSHANVE